MKRLGLFMTVIMILCITVNAQKQSNRTLVAYFSATGTTEKAAKQVAEVTGGALYEIQPAKKYTSACILRGEIVNVSVDERALDKNGKVDASKVIPVIFDPFNNDYLKVGEKVGNAFSDGKALK